MDSRYYLQALGITGLFVTLIIFFWIASGGKAASDAQIESANNTRTAIAMTGSYLMQPRTGTPRPAFTPPTFSPQTNVPGSTSTVAVMPSPTSTSLLAQFNTPVSPIEPSLTPLPTQAVVTQAPVFTTPVASGQLGTRIAPSLPQLGTPQTVPTAVPANLRDPAEFARWYFARVWNERDYQNLWDNYLTPSYKANVGSGLFEDYVWWWNTVDHVDVNAVDVLENNGTNARLRLNLTFSMQDGRVLENQVYEYDFLFDPTRGTWMFDVSL